MSDSEDRRKSPRVAVPGRCVVRTEQRIPVRLLDISAAGALLQTDERLPLGGVGRLRLSLGGAALGARAGVVRRACTLWSAP